MNVPITVGVDPGVSGAVGVLVGDAAVVFDVPVIEAKIRRKAKSGENKGKMIDVLDRRFDLKAMYNLLYGFKDHADVVVAIEKVGPSKNDKAPQMFAFGKGIGYWEMATVACDYTLVEVSPQTWKKGFPEITDHSTVLPFREDLAALRGELKVAKDKKRKLRINEEIRATNLKLKAAAKSAAREVAAAFYPDIKDCFKLKKHDGRAEAILIARYAQQNKLGRS